MGLQIIHCWLIVFSSIILIVGYSCFFYVCIHSNKVSCSPRYHVRKFNFFSLVLVQVLVPWWNTCEIIVKQKKYSNHHRLLFKKNQNQWIKQQCQNFREQQTKLCDQSDSLTSTHMLHLLVTSPQSFEGFTSASVSCL